MPKDKKKEQLPSEHWKDEPDGHDFPAASDYLSLIMAEHAVAAAVSALRTVPLIRRKAKDLLRASGLASPAPRQRPRGQRPRQGPQGRAALSGAARPGPGRRWACP